MHQVFKNIWDLLQPPKGLTSVVEPSDVLNAAQHVQDRKATSYPNRANDRFNPPACNPTLGAEDGANKPMIEEDLAVRYWRFQCRDHF